MDWLHILYDIAYFLVVTVFFKYILVRWFAEKMGKWLKIVLVRNQRHAVYWLHYREKARGRGHQYPTPELCQDGVCRTLDKIIPR